MICVECAAPVRSLYTYYSDDNINVTKCANCGLFVDKYIECEPILVAIDLLLLRPAAVRHVVFNASAGYMMERAPGSASTVSPQATPSPRTTPNPVWTFNKLSSVPKYESVHPEQLTVAQSTLWSSVVTRGNSSVWGIPVQVLRLIILAVLFDVYQQWAMCEKSTDPLVQRFLSLKSPAFQYAMFLTFCSVDTFIVHFTVRSMASLLFNWENGGAISTALLIGSFSKLLPILTFIWHYDMPFVTHMVRYAALFCVVEILTIILQCGYTRSIALTLSGVVVSMTMNNIFWNVVKLLD